MGCLLYVTWQQRKENVFKKIHTNDKKCRGWRQTSGQLPLSALLSDPSVSGPHPQHLCYGCSVLGTPSCLCDASSRKKRGNFCQNPPLTSDLTGLLWIPNPVNSKGKENSIQGRFRLMRIHLLGLAWGQLSPKLQAVWRRLRGWLSSVAVS